MRLAVSHADRKALEIFAREISPAGTSWSPGTTGSLNAGRPSVAPQVKQFAFLLPKVRRDPARHDRRRARRNQGSRGRRRAVASLARMRIRPELQAPADAATVPLVRIAHGRSGDKGDSSNVGIIARKPEYQPWIASQVTAEAVREYLGHLVKGRVTRYALPGIGALNFVLERALGGGGMASLRNDPLGKGMAQLVLAMPVRDSERLALADGLAQRVDQILRRKRLLQRARGAELARDLEIIRSAVGTAAGHHDDLRVRKFAAQPDDRLHAFGLGHEEVGQDDGGGMLALHLERFDAVARKGHVVALELEQHPQEIAHAGVVVDDEHPNRCRIFRGLGGHGGTYTDRLSWR
jgi:hypothetical protein